jgi:hypothetical protein
MADVAQACAAHSGVDELSAARAKTLSASLRSGFVAANADTIGALVDLKMITRGNSSGYVVQIIYDLITSGRYRGHLKRLIRRIQTAVGEAFDTLAQLGLPVFGRPRGGFYASTCGEACRATRTTRICRAAPPSKASCWPRIDLHPRFAAVAWHACQHRLYRRPALRRFCFKDEFSIGEVKVQQILRQDDIPASEIE